MILYDYYSNDILTRSIKIRTKEATEEKYKELHGTLVTRGLHPQMQRFDIEVSKVFLELTKNENIEFQLVPEHIHWRYAAEREIRT